MKKNFSVNIGNRLFNIDEDAYECLNSYLARLRNYFSVNEGYEEIMADIEMRIAELLDQQIAQGQALIVLDHIRQVIAGMGEPDQLSDSENNSPKASAHPRATGRLYRDPVNRQIGGVAAGISAFFGIDPLWIRLIFVALTLLYGSGPIIYIVLWLILPEAQTTSEKLEMQRQMINIGTLRDELASAGSGIKKTSNSLLHSTGNLLRFTTEIIIRLFRWVFGIFSRMAGLIMLLLMIFMFVGIGLAFLIREHLEIGSYELDSITMVNAFQWMLPGVAVSWLAFISIALLVIAFSGFMIYFGLRLLLKWPPLRWQVVTVFALMLVAGLFIAGSTIFQYSRSNKDTDSVTQRRSMLLNGNRVHLTTGSHGVHEYLTTTGNDTTFARITDVLGQISLSVRPVPSDSIIITLIKSASARQELSAAEYAGNIAWSYDFQDSLLTLNPYFSIPHKDGMRYQELNVIVGIPVNTEVQIDKELSWRTSFRDFLDDRKDGGIYIMTNSGLKAKNPPAEVKDTIS